MLDIRVEFNSKRSMLQRELKQECYNCGHKDNLHIHHVVPLSIGGTNKTTNLVMLCTDCHGKVHNRDFVKYKELQRLGFERAKREGRLMGRPRKEMPSNFIKIYKLWKLGEITAIEAMKRIDMKPNTFYRRVKEYEQENNIKIGG